jgi:nucleoside-diphosphate-sugar epimerase
MTCRYLVTGAQGFIGRYLIAHLLDHFPHSTVLGIGRSPDQNSHFHHTISCGDLAVAAPLPAQLRSVGVGRYSYVSSDLSSTTLLELIREFRPTSIIHLAGSLRGLSEEIVFQNNVRSTEGLLDTIRASGLTIRLLLLASSGGVYGRQDSLPIAETASVRPVDVYSRSKLACEDLARSFALESGISIAIARIFNVFGPGQDELHFAGRMAGRLAAILAGKSPPVILAGPLSSTRDFLDVRDVCSAFGAVLERNLEGVYNIASGVETNVGDLLQLLLQVTGLQTAVEIRSATDRLDPIPRHVANIDRLSEAGCAPQYSLAATCRDMLNYYTDLVYA